MRLQKGNTIVFAEYQIKKNYREQVIELVKQVQKLSTKEPGCIQYTTHHTVEDPNKVILYEIYVDEAAFEQHRASSHFQEIVVQQIVPLLESRKVSYLSLIL